MALTLEQKQVVVAEVNEIAASALSAVVADYRGLTVTQMTEMRAKARATGVYMRVVRNTLAKRAVEGTEYECLDESFVPLLDGEHQGAVPSRSRRRAADDHQRRTLLRRGPLRSVLLSPARERPDQAPRAAPAVHNQAAALAG